jgi:hypothetical protein
MTVETSQAHVLSEDGAVFNDEAVFQYHSRSRDVAPGKGAGLGQVLAK